MDGQLLWQQLAKKKTTQTLKTNKGTSRTEYVPTVCEYHDHEIHGQFEYACKALIDSKPYSNNLNIRTLY